MRTPDLFDGPAMPAPSARRTDPFTSHEAAASVKPSPGRLLALGLLFQNGPLTDFELAALSGLQQTSIGKRRGECSAAGLIEPMVVFGTKGRSATRPAPSGARAIVWRITQDGIDFYREHSAK